MFKNKVKELLENALLERQDLFLIDFKVGEDNAIKVVIDGDNGVVVEDCMYISRAIEHNLDREQEDFSIVVTSAGATSPLINPRQYKKNKGRLLEVKTKDNQILEAMLLETNTDSVVLEWKAREPKPVGKGKITVKKQAEIKYDAILAAQVIIKF